MSQMKDLHVKVRRLREQMAAFPHLAPLFEGALREASAELDAAKLQVLPQEPVRFLVPPQHDGFINFRVLCRNPGGEQ